MINNLVRSSTGNRPLNYQGCGTSGSFGRSRSNGRGGSDLRSSSRAKNRNQNCKTTTRRPVPRPSPTPDEANNHNNPPPVPKPTIDHLNSPVPKPTPPHYLNDPSHVPNPTTDNLNNPFTPDDSKNPTDNSGPSNGKTRFLEKLKTKLTKASEWFNENKEKSLSDIMVRGWKEDCSEPNLQNSFDNCKKRNMQLGNPKPEAACKNNKRDKERLNVIFHDYFNWF